MRKAVTTCLVAVLLALSIANAHASVTIYATINEGVSVDFTFEDIEPTLYNQTVQQGLFNVSTIPQAVQEYFMQRNLTNVIMDYNHTQEVFNNLTKSIHVSFSLAGPDIIHVTVSRETANRVYNVTTGWRKFSINLTDAFLLDFAEYFGKLMPYWQLVNYTDIENKTHPAYYNSYNYTAGPTFELKWYYVLPATAINVSAVEDNIIFELPPWFEDSLLNSPFLILIALIIVNVAVFLYRRGRK